jgi:hypothetical protein
MKQVFLLACIFCLFGCSGGKKEVIETTNEFFSAIKYDKQEVMGRIYPDIYQIGSWWKSDEIEIQEVKRLKRGEFSATVDSRFTNGFGKSDVKEITLFLRRGKEHRDNYVVYDSKNLGADFNRENDVYYYALQVGCIDETKDEQDQAIAKKMADASMMMTWEVVELAGHLRSQITVSSWHWRSNYWGSGASGEAIFINNSDLDVPMPKYLIEYKNRNGDVLTTDWGYITYDTFRSGTREHVSFYSNYTAGASKASISLYVDDTLLPKMETYIARNKYHSGNEYRDYLQAQQEKSYTPAPMLPADSIENKAN